jgi:hypothetical protein
VGWFYGTSTISTHRENIYLSTQPDKYIRLKRIVYNPTHVNPFRPKGISWCDTEKENPNDFWIIDNISI